MYAVVRTGGKQYRVSAGDILEVEKLSGDVGDSIALDDVLMVGSGESVVVGQPTIENASVQAKITGQYRGKKIRIMRYRPKKRIRVRKGHRQYLTRLEIASIRHGDEVYEAEVEVAPEPVVAPVVESADEDAWAEEDVIEAEGAIEEVAEIVEVADMNEIEAEAEDAIEEVAEIVEEADMNEVEAEVEDAIEEVTEIVEEADTNEVEAEDKTAAEDEIEDATTSIDDDASSDKE